MKPKSALVVLAIAVVLVIVLFLFENPFSSRQGTMEKGMEIEKVKLFTGVTRENVARMVVSRFDGRTTATLTQIGGVWYTNVEKKHIADAKGLEMIFSAIQGAREGDVVSRNPENQAKFGVNKMLGIRVQFYDSKGALLEDVILGRGGRGDFLSSYVLRAHSNDVLKVAAMLPYLFERGGEEAWREHTIFDNPPENIIALSIAGGKENYRLLKYASGDWELLEPNMQSADRTIAEQMTRTIGRLRATGFEDNETTKPLSEFGLEKPEIVVTVSLKDYSTTPVLYIGGETPKMKGSFYAKCPDRDQIYLISQYQAEVFTKKAAELLKKPEAAEKAKPSAQPAKGKSGMTAQKSSTGSTKPAQKVDAAKRPPSQPTTK